MEQKDTWDAATFRWALANVLRDLGIVALYQTDYSQARALFEESLTIVRETEQKWGIAYALASLGSIELRQDDHLAAERHLKESLVIGSELKDKQIIAQCLERLAHIASSAHRVLLAARIWRATQALREATGAILPPPDVEFYTHAIEAARLQTDDPSWQAAWIEGRSMLVDEVITLTLGVPLGAHVLPGPEEDASAMLLPPYPDDLTTREVEVLHLLASGLTNAQIANQLYLSRRTVHAHLRSIYGKIQVNSRNAATRYAIEHGLF